LHIIERVPLPVRANAENIRYLMTKRDRMGHDLVGLDDYDEAVSMDDYDEAVYLLGDRRPPSANDSGDIPGSGAAPVGGVVGDDK
jgi:3,4-dihydroxy 2-butanone 4-phosphate synthase/GTP cyclohydrolase II